MKVPGPDHPITIAAAPRRVEALFEGHIIADSAEALLLKEAGYKAVYYFPRKDVGMAFLNRTDRHTTCPYKGEASYFTIVRDGRFAENAVWTYEDPYPAVELIRDHVAFYPNMVEMHEIDRGVRIPIAEVVEHTDSGSGASQLDHWPSNVSEPVEEPEIEKPFSGTGSI